MGKNQDLIIILIIVILGMFFPFLGSLMMMFDLSITTVDGWLIIVKTFGWFLFIFALELGGVYLYFTISNSVAQKKIDQQSMRKQK